MADLTKLSHSSLHNYQQVFLQGTLTLNGDVQTVDHNLGYIPYVRVWGTQIAGEVGSIVVVSSLSSYHSRYISSASIIDVKVSTTTLSAENTVNGPATLYYRIYIDNSARQS